MKDRTIVLVGGGSGGHLTPLKSVARAIRQTDTHVTIAFIGQKYEDLREILDDPAIDEQYAISAGKFRRYHGSGVLRHLFDFHTILLNGRDFFRFLAGIFQAWRALGVIKPDAIFLKGGFVCVPVGIAARWRRIPYMTHDSDAIPGLANRLTAKHATYNATALPAELYPYSPKKAIQTGIPISDAFQPLTEQQVKLAKQHLKIPMSAKVLLCVGGGLGAQKVNRALVAASETILTAFPQLYIIHVTGKKLFEETASAYSHSLPPALLKRLQLIDLSAELHALSAAADVILTRGGATAIAEFAAQKKACIVVPNPVLTGGQQLHNARVLQKAKAALIVQENELDELPKQITAMLKKSKSELALMGKKLHAISKDNAAHEIAKLLIKLSYK